MNPEFDKEIDSLLRRSARLAAAGAKRAGAAPSTRESTHLDADELSAFAEGALPGAARTAAASHLADCDDCRSFVVRLSSSADAAGEIEKRAAVPPVPAAKSWWKSLLGALSAPSVLRYATPVLVLGLVGVISFIALRSRDGRVPETVYQPSEGTGVGVVTSSGTDANTGIGNFSRTTSEAPSSTVEAEKAATMPVDGASQGPTARPDELKESDKDSAQPARTESETASGGGAALADSELKERSVAAPSAPAATAPPPSKAGPETAEPPKSYREDGSKKKAAELEEEYAANERGRQADQNRAANQQRKLEIQMPDDSARNESRSNTVSNRSLGAVNQAPARAPRAAMKRGKSDDASRDSRGEDDAVADERTIAGHRFRRQGGAWVDVNYKPSMSMTGVRRGTDGYRALVYDIPELGRIAEHFGGEVIVVVKSKAYRIR